MIFGIEDVLPVYGFLKTYFMMVSNMKDYVTLDDDDYDADFRYNYRDNLIAHFKQNLNIKNFSLQDEGNCDENDFLRKRTMFWLNVIDMGDSIPDTVYD